MKRYFVFLAAAAALVACSKNELIPVESVDSQTEISFLTAPMTKADSYREFASTNVFESIAYYIPFSNDGKVQSWDYKTTYSPTLYIGTEDASNNATGVTIAKVDETVDGNNTYYIWRNAKYDTQNSKWVSDKSYYWPKKGSLTFFAWSLNKANLDFGGSAKVVCTVTDGITLSDFNIDDNKNIDFMVADIAADKTANESKYQTTSMVKNGVPTLFRHRFSNIYFTAKTDQDYSSTIKFELNSIVFEDLADQASYKQNPEAVITVDGSYSEQTYVTGSTQEVTATETAVDTKGGQTIYLPQKFEAANADDQVVVIKYTVTYTLDSGKTITENVTETKKLSELFKVTGETYGQWEMGKKYTLDLTFKLNEILWDPAVEDWSEDNTTKHDVTVNP